MFNFDEKRFFCDDMHSDRGSFPHEKPRYTMTEEINHTTQQMRETIDRLLKFEQRAKDEIENRLQHVTSDNVIFKSAMREAWAAFIQEVKNEVNLFEGNVDALITMNQKNVESNYANLSEEIRTAFDVFREAVNQRIESYDGNHNTRFNEFKREVETMLDEFESEIREAFNSATSNMDIRFSAQDNKIANAEMYMRTNLNGSLETLLYSMKENGQLTGVIESELFATPEMFGAVADGETDITAAFNSAVQKSGVVIVPKGVHVIRGNITLDKTVAIIGFGDESVLRVYGTIKTDSDASHVLKLHNLKIENYNISGNAIEVVKTNDSNAKNTFTADGVRFFANNNVSTDYVSNTLYMKGVREATIQNCIFEGVSSDYGTAIKLAGDSDEMTVNVTVVNNHFYNYKTAIDAETNVESIVYLAGLRIVNNTIIGCTYGVKGANVDTMFVYDNMIDYVSNPVYCETVGRLVVRGNYLQTIREKACVYLANNRTADISMIDISDNYMWCATDNKEANGIVLSGVGAKINYSIIDKNCFNALNTCIKFTNCQGVKVSNSIAKNCLVFFDGGSSTIIDLFDNYAEATVVTFMKNFHASGKLHGNRHGVKFDHNRGKLIETANGQVDTFKAEHKLLAAGTWANAHIGSSDILDNAFAVSYDETYIYFKFKESPANGQTLVINWECAI